MRQIHLRFNDEVAKKLDTLRTRMGVKTDGEVIARALAIADPITMHVATGGKVIFTHPTGELVEFNIEPDREDQDTGDGT